jgi:hypothetical protein
MKQGTLFEINSTVKEPAVNKRKYSYKQAVKVLKQGGHIQYLHSKPTYKFKLLKIQLSICTEQLLKH